MACCWGPSLPQQLLTAARTGDNNLVRGLLHKHHELVQYKQAADGQTVLHIAAGSLNAEAVSLALQAGADPNMADLKGNTPLLAATKAVCKGMSQTLLDFQVIMDQLVSSRADVNQGDDKGNPPLLLACEAGAWDVAWRLLTVQAKIDACDGEGNNALHFLASKPTTGDRLAYFIQQADVAPGRLARMCKQKGSKGQTPLHVAVSTRNQLAVCYLLSVQGLLTDQPDESGNTALSVAVSARDVEVAELLIVVGNASGVDQATCTERMPHLTTALTQTPFSRVGRGGNTRLHLAVGYDCPLLLTRCCDDAVRHRHDVNAPNAEGHAALHLALMDLRAPAAKTLICELPGIDVNLPSGTGFLPVHLALERLSGEVLLEMLQLLFSHGAKFTAVHRSSGTGPLHWAVRYRRAEGLKWLLEQPGVDIGAMDGNGMTALHLAADLLYLDMVELLTAKGADVNAQSPAVPTPLHLAAAKPRARPVVEHLVLACNADVFARDSMGRTAAHNALDAGHFELLPILYSSTGAMPHADDVKDQLGRTTLCAAIECEASLDIIKVVRGKGNAGVNTACLDGRTPLLCAINQHRLDVVEYLVAEGADVNLAGPSGNGPLCACMMGAHDQPTLRPPAWHNLPQDQARADRLQMLNCLLKSAQSSLQVDAKLGQFGCTALHIAASQVDLVLAETLITSAGANVNLPAADSRTAFHIAVEQRSLEFVELLLAQSALQPNQQDASGSTALHLAVRMVLPDIVAAILGRQDAKADLQDHTGFRPLDIALCLVCQGSFPDTILTALVEPGQLDLGYMLPGICKSPLHIAVELGRLDLVQMFVEKGQAPLDVQDAEGYTPLHLAVRHSYVKIADYVLKKGADADIASVSGDTPMHAAVGLVHQYMRLDVLQELVMLLLQLGQPNLDVVNIAGATPLSLAATVALATVKHATLREAAMAVVRMLLPKADANVPVRVDVAAARKLLQEKPAELQPVPVHVSLMLGRLNSLHQQRMQMAAQAKGPAVTASIDSISLSFDDMLEEPAMSPSTPPAAVTPVDAVASASPFATAAATAIAEAAAKLASTTGPALSHASEGIQFSPHTPAGSMQLPLQMSGQSSLPQSIKTGSSQHSYASAEHHSSKGSKRNSGIRRKLVKMIASIGKSPQTQLPAATVLGMRTVFTPILPPAPQLVTGTSVSVSDCMALAPTPSGASLSTLASTTGSSQAFPDHMLPVTPLMAKKPCLHWCLDQLDIDVVKLLLFQQTEDKQAKSAADCNILDWSGTSPLVQILNQIRDLPKPTVWDMVTAGASAPHDVAKKDEALWVKLVNLAELLLQHGADPNIPSPPPENMPPLFTVVNCGSKRALMVMQAMVDKNARVPLKVNIQDRLGSTALHMAVQQKDDKMAEKLWMCEDLDPNIMDDQGMTPLCYAVKDLNTHLVDLLTRKKKIRRILDEAAFAPDEAYVCDVNLSKRIEDRPIMLAMKALRADAKVPASVFESVNQIVNCLLQTGVCNINVQDEDGSTPVHHLVQALPADGRAQEMRFNILQVLMDQGAAQADLRDKDGCTPLHLVATQEYAKPMLEQLLQGVDCTGHTAMEVQDNLGRNPLHVAASKPGNKDVVNLLADHGANLEAKDHEGRTPLYYAAIAQDESLCRVMIKYGASVRSNDIFLKSPLDYLKNDQVAVKLKTQAAREQPVAPTKASSLVRASEAVHVPVMLPMVALGLAGLGQELTILRHKLDIMHAIDNVGKPGQEHEQSAASINKMFDDVFRTVGAIGGVLLLVKVAHLVLDQYNSCIVNRQKAIRIARRVQNMYPILQEMYVRFSDVQKRSDISDGMKTALKGHLTCVFSALQQCLRLVRAWQMDRTANLGKMREFLKSKCYEEEFADADNELYRSYSELGVAVQLLEFMRGIVVKPPQHDVWEQQVKLDKKTDRDRLQEYLNNWLQSMEQMQDMLRGNREDVKEILCLMRNNGLVIERLEGGLTDVAHRLELLVRHQQETKEDLKVDLQAIMNKLPADSAADSGQASVSDIDSKWFKQWDTDGDGLLSAAEIAQWMKTILNLTITLPEAEAIVRLHSKAAGLSIQQALALKQLLNEDCKSAFGKWSKDKEGKLDGHTVQYHVLVELKLEYSEERLSEQFTALNNAQGLFDLRALREIVLYIIQHFLQARLLA